MISRSSRFVTASVWLLAALGAAPAGGQQPVGALAGAQPPAGAPAWLRARLTGRLDARTRPVVERVIDSAYALGIPAEPLVDKALEGASKGGTGDAIVRAVRMLAVDLATARRSLGTASLADELSAGAAALRAGVDAKSLERLRHDRPGQPLSVALGVLSELIGRGVPVAAATDNVLKLTQAGIADEQLVAFRRDVDRDVGMGAAPAAAAMVRALDFARNLSTNGTVIATPPGGRPNGTGKIRP